MTLNDLLLSKDPNQINRAFKELLTNPKNVAKIRQWLKYFNLQSIIPEEILQDSIIEFYDKILEDKFKGISSAETFLLGIAKNKIRNILRKINPNVEIDETFGEPTDMLTNIEAIEEQNEDDELQQALQIAINKIDPTCNERMILHHVMKKTMEEVAKEVGLANDVQARKAIYRCREKLRDILSGNPLIKSRFPKLFK